MPRPMRSNDISSPAPAGPSPIATSGRAVAAAFLRPVVLVYSESLDTIAMARWRETQIKKWSRAKKESLMAGDLDTLHTLSRR
jgi:predicted GIY-YIG superfamily endonuclease